MKIPEKINIAGIDINIEFSDIEGCGEYLHGECVIKISNKIKKTLQYSTFLHEVVEAIDVIYDIKLKHHQILLIEAGLNDLGVKIKESK